MLLSEYEREYERAKRNPEGFWGEKARNMLEWSKEFTKVYGGNFGDDKWFYDGELNACYNCIDRWANKTPENIAIIFDDNEGNTQKFTYKESLGRILEIAHELKHLKKGDCVTVYLAMSPEAVFTVLACARLGITHNVVFGGFSSESLRLRVIDSRSKMIITQDVSVRGDKKINFLETVAKAETNLPILIFDSHKKSLPNATLWSKITKSREYIAPVPVEAEHPLFYLYTSGSTGQPKGLVHSTGGYLLYAAYTAQTAFDLRDGDIFCCTADIGWITGHSYSTYAPLCLGITTVILEGLPTYPTPYRFYDIVSKYKITQFYTAPTSIRILKKYFDEQKANNSTVNSNKNDLDDSNNELTINSNLDDCRSYSFLNSGRDFKNLRALGSVGEPINREAHKFFSESFGGLHVVDTYWQTETGGFMIAPIFGVKKAVPECAMLPMPGIVPFISDESPEEANRHLEKHLIENLTNEKEKNLTNLATELGRIFITKSWPGISRGILNDKERYNKTYFSNSVYFTGDEGYKDSDGHIWIMGRADDVINVSGHRISTAEVESAACSNQNVAEAAIISVCHEIKGQTMLLFVVLKSFDPQYEEKIKNTISGAIGGFCRPERVISVDGIPKTATGKIMRRVLRALVTDRDTGDLSTLVNKEVVQSIKDVLMKLN